jgi:hypothetical protein
LDIEENPKAKKKAKAAEIVCLSRLNLQGIIDKAKPLDQVKFEAFDLRDPQEPKINILNSIDLTSPLELLDLFIPLKMYSTITENTNLYAIARNACTTPTSTNKQYWWPTNPNEI